MNRTILATIALVTGLTLAVPAGAQEAKAYGEEAGWYIYSNQSGCYMVTHYEKDVVLSVFSNGTTNANFWVQSPAWQSLEDGAKNRIQVEFDDMGEWNIDARTRSDHDGPGLSWNGNIDSDEDGNTFFGEFMAANRMSIRYGDRSVANLRLNGSYKASMKLAACVIDNKNLADPFAGRDGRRDPADPFS